MQEDGGNDTTRDPGDEVLQFPPAERRRKPVSPILRGRRRGRFRGAHFLVARHYRFLPVLFDNRISPATTRNVAFNAFHYFRRARREMCSVKREDKKWRAKIWGNFSA